MNKIYVALAAVILCAVSLTSCLAADSIQTIGKDVKINWTTLYYTVEGEGAMPKADVCPNRAIAKLKARDYAKMAAIANLQMAIEGTSISYEANGKDYMADVTIRQKIEGFVKNVEIVGYRDEVIEGDTIVVAILKAPMFGKNSPASVFLAEPEPPVAAVKPVEPTQPDVETTTKTTTGNVTVETNVKVVTKPDFPATIKPAPKPVEAQTIDPAAPDVVAFAKPSAEGKPYTGLIIDATGYRIDRAMSPKIRKKDGSEVWGTVKADFDFIADKGIVSYATSLQDAKINKRAGSNPLILRAVGKSGGKFYCDPVITDGDATIMIYENGKSHFLDQFNVVFVKDKAQ